MDPTLIALLEYGPTTTVLVVLAWGARSWWQSVSTHLCTAIPQLLGILEKFADSGFEVKVKLHLIEADDDTEEA